MRNIGSKRLAFIALLLCTTYMITTLLGNVGKERSEDRDQVQFKDKYGLSDYARVKRNLTEQGREAEIVMGKNSIIGVQDTRQSIPSINKNGITTSATVKRNDY